MVCWKFSSEYIYYDKTGTTDDVERRNIPPLIYFFIGAFWLEKEQSFSANSSVQMDFENF